MLVPGILCLLLANSALAQNLTLSDAADVGLKVGVPAPDFDLPDPAGARHHRDALAGPKGLVLVFFRSADW